MVTLRDIARQANVSVSTVSRILSDSNTPRAKEETKERVWKVTRELGYVPNKAARELRSKKKENENPAKEIPAIACLMTRPLAESDPFFVEISQAISTSVLQRGYTLKYLISANNMDLSSILQILEKGNILGIIILGKANSQFLHEMRKHYKNIVCCSLNAQANYSLDWVYCDGYMAAQEAVQYLIDKGHRSIGYIGELDHEMRYQGYCDCLKKNNIPFQRAYVWEGSFSMDGGYRVTQKRIDPDNHPTAFFCGNDATAVGVIKALKEKKISVPQEISLISVDDVDMSRYTDPMLTTVHIPKSDLGHMAAKTLIDQIESKNHIRFRMELPCYVVERESVKKL